MSDSLTPARTDERSGTDVLMPKLGLTMIEATVTEWLKREGEAVREGEPLFIFETDKSTLEFEAPTSGILKRILVEAGQTVPVYTPVALIVPAESAEAPAPVALPASLPEEAAPGRRRLRASPRAKKAARARGIQLADVFGTGPQGRIIERDVLSAISRRTQGTDGAEVTITPLARRVATAHDVDLTGVTGTGRDGRITRADVQAVVDQGAAPLAVEPVTLAVEYAAHSIEPAPLPDEIVPFGPIRSITAQRMVESVGQVAPVTLITDADATELMAARKQISELLSIKLTYNALLVGVVGRALVHFPALNGSYTPRGLRLHKQINVGVAVDTERGLIVPVVHDVAELGFEQIHARLQDLIERAQSGRSTPDDLTGGTFTITNLGMFDIDHFTPIVPLPQVAILGVGRITPKVVPHGGQIAIRERMALSLSFDHRAVDGAPAARFLKRVKDLIEKPYALILGSRKG